MCLKKIGIALIVFLLIGFSGVIYAQGIEGAIKAGEANSMGNDIAAAQTNVATNTNSEKASSVISPRDKRVLVLDFDPLVYSSSGTTESVTRLHKYMGWNDPPSLFVTMDGLDGGSEQFCDLLLGFAESFAAVDELLSVQNQLLIFFFKEYFKDQQKLKLLK